jgi:hypothetical protein
MSFTSNIPGLQNQLDISIELPEDPKEMRDMLNDVYQGIASTVNTKEGALYVPIEKLTSGQYFTPGNPQINREVYRMVVDFGTLPSTGTKNVAHNIVGWNDQFRLTRAYGAATDPIGLTAVPIPNDNIFLEINATNVIVTTTADFSTYTDSTIVIEFTKNL